MRPPAIPIISIGCRIGELSRGERDLLAASVEDDVKALHEGRAADKVHPGDIVPDVSHDEVYAVVPAAYEAVQRVGPRLGVRSQLERVAVDDE